MQGDKGCGEHSVCWRGEGGGGPGCGEASGGVGQPWEETEKGSPGERKWESALTGQCVLGFCWMRRVERESKRGVLGLLEEHTIAHRSRERTWRGGEA